MDSAEKGGTRAESSGEAPTQVAPPRGPSAASIAWLRPGAPLVLGEVLGEGGMGVVRSAIQPSLQRVVAVKTPKADSTSDDALFMLREAWVTGFLEHPSIVPIHEILLDERGAPLIVMRRIQGVTWHDCLRDPAWAAAAGARDLLEQNLRTFIDVCHAIVFAHEKGVLHRDIKPSNVMVGSFGEVYLLDWGIALALFGPAAEHLPLARDANEPAVPWRTWRRRWRGSSRRPSPSAPTCTCSGPFCSRSRRGLRRTATIRRRSRASGACPRCRRVCRPGSRRSACARCSRTRRRAMRNTIMLVLGSMWFVSSAFGDRFGPWTHLRFILGALLPIPVLVVVAVTSRELKRTLFNRRVLATMILMLASRAGLEATCWSLGIAVDVTRTLQIGLGLLVAAMAAITIDRRLWPMCVGLAAATAASVALPAHGSFLAALALLGVLVNFALVWRAHEKARTP